MSIIKDINELKPSSFKVFLFSTLFTMPFWYIALYLFKRSFLLDNPMHVPIVMAFCLTVCWLVLNILICIVSEWLWTIKEKDRKTKPELIIAGATVFAIGQLALYICIELGLKWDFFRFLAYVFGGQGVIIVQGLIRGLVLNIKKAKQATKMRN